MGQPGCKELAFERELKLFEKKFHKIPDLF
jgi:hypothetical protein